jgi:hypothetical protein
VSYHHFHRKFCGWSCVRVFCLFRASLLTKKKKKVKWDAISWQPQKIIFLASFQALHFPIDLCSLSPLQFAIIFKLKLIALYGLKWGGMKSPIF